MMDVCILPQSACVLLCTVFLGGLTDHLKEIKRCRRLIMIGCGTSYHAGVAVSVLFIDLFSLYFINRPATSNNNMLLPSKWNWKERYCILGLHDNEKKLTLRYYFFFWTWKQLSQMTCTYLEKVLAYNIISQLQGQKN